MSEPTLDYFRMLPLGYQHRCMCVAEVMESDPFETNFAGCG